MSHNLLKLINFCDSGTLRKIALSGFLATAAVTAQAQQEGRIAAVVNDEPISYVDLVERTDLIVFANSLPSTEEFKQRLMPQVLNTLIDEELQRQEAGAQNVEVSDRQIAKRMAGMEERNNLPPGGLDAFLESKGVARRALEKQIESSLKWSILVNRRLRPQVNIGDDEIDETLSQIKENRGKPQHLVSEIFVAVDDPASDESVRNSALRIAQQIGQGVRFNALARAFSQSATAAAGGDLGWLRKGQLDEAIEKVIATMQPGDIAGPVRSPDGYHILLLRDRRLAGATSTENVTVDLVQVGVPLSSAAPEKEIQKAVATARDIRALAPDCPALLGAQLPGAAKASRIGRMRVADLAPALHAPIMGLDKNQTTGPIRTQDAVVLFMVCDREVEAETPPDPEGIRQQLSLAKLDLLARRYLRDLRRAAFVEIR